MRTFHGIRKLFLTVSALMLVTAPQLGHASEVEIDHVEVKKVYNRLVCSVNSVYNPNNEAVKFVYKFYDGDKLLLTKVSTKSNNRIPVPLSAKAGRYGCDVAVKS